MSESAGISNKEHVNKMDVFEGVSPEVKIRTKKMLMWFIIFSIVMLFAGITSALIVLYGKLMWVSVTPPMVLYVSLILIILSSMTYVYGVRSAKTGNQKGGVIGVALTLLLGLGFIVTQNAGWKELASRGMGYSVSETEEGLKAYRWNDLGKIRGEYGKDYFIEFQGQRLVKVGNEYYMPADTGRLNPVTTKVVSTFNAAGALLSVLIYVHIIHLSFGLIYLVVNLIRASKGFFATKDNWVSLYAGGMYWHFMGFLWIYLFFFMFFIY